jgi:hypothetical protein
MALKDLGRHRLRTTGEGEAGLLARVLKASAIWWGGVFAGLCVLVLTVDTPGDWLSDARTYALAMTLAMVWSVLAARVLVSARRRLRRETVGRATCLILLGAAVLGVVSTLSAYSPPSPSYANVSFLITLETSVQFNILMCSGWFFIYLHISSTYTSTQIAEHLAHLHREALLAQNETIRTRVQPEVIGADLVRLRASLFDAGKAEAQAMLLKLAEGLRLALDRSPGAVEAAAAPDLNRGGADALPPICDTVPRLMTDSIMSFGAANCAAWAIIFLVFATLKTPIYLAFKGVPVEINMLTVNAVYCLCGCASTWICRAIWLKLQAISNIAGRFAGMGVTFLLAAYVSALAPAEVNALFHGWRAIALREYLIHAFYYIWIYVSLFFVYYYARSLRRELTQRVLLAQAAEAAAAARNSAPRYQVRPHFLFNALNALYALIMDARWAQAHEMTDALCLYIDRSFAEDERDFVPVSEQADALGAYLSIETIRFGERLRFRSEIPEDLSQARAPALILHPLVENAMKHAVATSSDAVEVEIRVRREGDDLILAVQDSGGDPEAPSGPGLGIGLDNVRARLAGHYGARGNLDCKRLTPKGFVAEIRLPLEFAWTPSAA